jgi:peptidoglycan/LPS O-acetylase OafA/YrhL
MAKMKQNSSVGREQRGETFHLGYQPALDGFRGVAILLVVLDHLGFLGAQAGFVGVDIFFVLSGFLITSLLIAEWQQFQTISFKSFYWRRALRLLPALITMLTVFLIYLCFVSPLKMVVQNLRYALEALFYFTNWATIMTLGERANHLFNHTWSLSIEEQFYLIWPAVLFFSLRFTRTKTSLLWLVLLGALLSDLVRIIFVTMDVTNFWRYYCGLDTRADSLLIGCFAGAAISFRLLPRRRWLEIIFKISAAISVVALIFFARQEQELHSAWMYCAGWFLISVCAAAIIVQVVFVKNLLNLCLESSPLVYVGKISYGLYLWHYPTFYIIKSFHRPHWQCAAVPIVAALTLISYYFIELPFLRRKKQFEKV